MKPKSYFLCLVAAVLGLVYAVYFTDWFRKESIFIIPVTRPNQASKIPRTDDHDVAPVIFKLSRDFTLTEVKVVESEEYHTNVYAAPLWHVVSEKGSAPTDMVVYGGRVRGMTSKIPRTKPRPLDPGTAYLVLMKAGGIRGQTNFYTREIIKRK